MQAVILAGGLGTRLRPLTRAIPKPMVSVAGKPFLEHQLKWLQAQGITDIVLLTGYLGEQIENYFGDGSNQGFRITYSREPLPLGTGGALKLAESLLDDVVLLVYGDSLLPIVYAPAASLLRFGEREAVILVYRDATGETSVAANIALEGNSVRRYEKNTGGPDLQFVDAGVLALSRRVLSRIPPGVVVSLEQDIFPQLVADRALAAWISPQRFYDIGTPERLQTLERWLLDRAADDDHYLIAGNIP